MKVSLDGGSTWTETDGVRVLYDDLTCLDEQECTLLVNCTDEGVIQDVNDDQDGANVATSSEMAQEIVDRLTTDGWEQLCKRTDEPKLKALEAMLDDAGIPHRRNGRSFHAPILEVAEDRWEEAFDILTPIDNIPDDDPRWDDYRDDEE